MTMICDRLGIAYFSVPKVACTSVKQALHALEYGTPFAPTRRYPNIHRRHRTLPFDPRLAARAEGLWKIAIIRDPIARILSAYARNGATIGRNELRQAYIDRGRTRVARSVRARLARRIGNDAVPEVWDGLATRPGLDVFCTQLERYRAAFRTVHHHTRPQSDFLGPDLAWYDAVYRIEDLATLERDLSARLGREVTLPHDNASKPRERVGLEQVSPAGQQGLIAATRAEYAYLAPHYHPPALEAA